MTSSDPISETTPVVALTVPDTETATGIFDTVAEERIDTYQENETVWRWQKPWRRVLRHTSNFGADVMPNTFTSTRAELKGWGGSGGTSAAMGSRSTKPETW